MIVRYLVNGSVATVVHFIALYLLVEIALTPSVGVANLVASVFGIGSSFLGNKYYVFAAGLSPMRRQLVLFVSFYALLALMHGSILYLWSDVLRFHYFSGFAIALVIQVVLGYAVNKHVVFKNNLPPGAPQ